MAGKMETELYKLGRSGLINAPSDSLDTVKAAELLYGERYDIRTYRGAAEILRALGIKSVRVLTDNADKFKAIREIGINVNRIKTGTNKADCEIHIEAKHKTPPYNDASWLEC
jgi:GTP cyclohydrolase II